jgi:alkaline phosphatase
MVFQICGAYRVVPLSQDKAEPASCHIAVQRLTAARIQNRRNSAMVIRSILPIVPGGVAFTKAGFYRASNRAAWYQYAISASAQWNNPMKRPVSCGLLCCLLLSSTPTMARDGALDADAGLVRQPRQVILIIGDGMDEQQITIARNYLKGAAGQLLLDQMPLRAAAQILTTEERENGKPVYVADSANTATSMATGAITSTGRISTSAGSDKDLTTIVELAAAAGLRSGIVTTASVTDATAAAFATHISFRLCEDPANMVSVRYKDIPMGDCSGDLKANGGKGSIAEQLVESPLDVILGGGGDRFNPTAEGESVSVVDLARRQGFQVVTSAAQLSSAVPDKRLLGLFSTSTMPVRLQGEGGREAEAPRPSWLNRLHPYLGSVKMPKAMVCEPNPDFARVPTLQQMTDAALRHLSHDNDQGFFLMIESASIDKQSHERKPCGSIGEVEQLEEALASALTFAQMHPHTLVLVTSDHSQAAQLVPYESLYSAFPIPIYTPGKLARIITPEGGRMAVNYATNNFKQEEHTGAAVPLFGNSEALGRIPPFIQQPQIFTITRDYLGL